MTHIDSVDFATLAEIAATIAKDVGHAIRKMRAQGVEIANTKSSLADVVTAADGEAERLITAALREARPNDGILGEEGASVEGNTAITWVVDPIDGTVNYLYDLPGYAVSIAATVADGADGTMADGRRAVAGAVYVPTLDELFEAHEGGGARLNGRTLQPQEAPQLALSLIATGFGYTAERRAEQAEILRRVLPQVRDIRRLGAAAADLCNLAAGRIDAYYERGLQPWDYAAGVLIAREAGATILGRDDETPPGETLMIAGPHALALSLRDAIHGV